MSVRFSELFRRTRSEDKITVTGGSRVYRTSSKEELSGSIVIFFRNGGIAKWEALVKKTYK